MKETWCHLSGVKGVGAPSFRIGVGVESSDVVKKKDLAGGEYVRLKNSALPLLLLSLALGVKVRRGRNTGTVVRRVEEGIRIQAEKEKPEEDGKLQRRHGIGGGVEAKRQVSGWPEPNISLHFISTSSRFIGSRTFLTTWRSFPPQQWGCEWERSSADKGP